MINNLIEEQTKLINKFYEKLIKTTYLDILINNKLAFNQIKSSLNYLKVTSQSIRHYYEKTQNEDKIDDAEKSILIFGLLQSLFVAIDSLYELSRGITNEKWSININANEHLLKIKHIRNDVVGHPVNRIKQKRIVGFCNLDLENVTLKNLKYKSFTVIDKKEEEKNYSIDIYQLLENYFKESIEILNKIFIKLQLQEKILLTDQTNSLTEAVNEIAKNIKNKKESKTKILKIKDVFFNKDSNKSANTNRFIWRLDLINILLNWVEEDSELQQVVVYILNQELLTFRSMAIKFDMINEVDVKSITLKKLKEPPIIEKYNEFVNNNKKYIKSLKGIIQDSKHPLFKSTLENFKSQFDNKKIEKLFNWLLNLSDVNHSRVYLLGTLLKRK